MNIDVPWFGALIERSPYRSQRGLARAMGIDASALSLTLRGKRRLQLDEAKRLAEMLGVPLPEILRRAGLPMPTGQHQVPLIGRVDGSGEAVLDWSHLDEAEQVPGPSDLPHDAVAVQCRTAGSPLDPLDGWVVYTSSQQPPTEALGRMALAAIKDEAGTRRVLLAHVGRGYQPGRYNLTIGMRLDTAPRRENVELVWVAPALWIRP